MDVSQTFKYFGSNDGSPHEVPDETSWPKPILGRTVTYIVAGVVIKDGKVLMIQEAKESCYGKWYLPAGRVERGETFAQAVIREVKEEANLDFKPTSLFALEANSRGAWFRFCFTGEITGGELKTVPDSESLMADWVPLAQLGTTFKLRGTDVLSVIEMYQQASSPLFPQLLVRPLARNHSAAVIIALSSIDLSKVSVLTRDGKLPVEYVNDALSLADITRVLKDAVKDGKNAPCEFSRCVHVEHDGRGGDGVWFYLLFVLTADKLKKPFQWSPLNDIACAWLEQSIAGNGCLVHQQ